MAENLRKRKVVCMSWCWVMQHTTCCEAQVMAGTVSLMDRHGAYLMSFVKKSNCALFIF